jgi:peptide deformylase
MSVREIVTIPGDVLRRKARKVTDFGPELQTLIDDMIETMRDAPGVGLAAPQEVPPKLYTFVNPEVKRESKDTNVGTEGCLSIPGFVGDVERPSEVIVKGKNRYGKSTRIRAKGWLARIFLHEIDHLDGVLFTDRAEKVWKLEEEEQPIQVAIGD